MSSPKKTKCSNCDKEIDSNKFFLHERFCEINVRKCSICKEPVQKDEYEEHKSVEHADPICAFCHKAFPNTEYDSHIKNCSKKLYECQYCGLFMNQNELKDHEYQCGSKTIKCEYCGENVTKTTYDLHLEYTCEKFNKNNNKDKKNDNNNIYEDINKIINKNKKEKNVNKKNVNKKNAKKRKRSDSEYSNEEEFKPQINKYQ